MDRILQSYVEIIAEKERHLKSVKPPLLAALKTIGASFAEVEYDGEGDSGQIEGIHAYNKDGQTISLKSQPITIGEGDTAESYESLEDCIETFAWDVIGLHHDGFENNEGGYGTLTINVADGTITLSHSDRFVDVTVTETEF